MKDVKWEAESWYVNFPKAKDLSLGQLVSLLTLKLQTKDYELTLLPPPNKFKSDPFPKQSTDQSLFQAEHFWPKSCLI